jgi:hypothetical protein
MGGNSAPAAHLHVHVDGVMVLLVTLPDVVIGNVPSDSHEIRAELSDLMHVDWDPPARVRGDRRPPAHFAARVNRG